MQANFLTLLFLFAFLFSKMHTRPFLIENNRELIITELPFFHLSLSGFL